MHKLLLRRSLVIRLFSKSKQDQAAKVLQHHLNSMSIQINKLNELSKRLLSEPKQLTDPSKTVPEVPTKSAEKKVPVSETEAVVGENQMNPIRDLSHEYLESVRLNILLNLPEQNSEKTVLVLAPLMQQNNKIFPGLGVSVLTLLGLYQAYAGIYNYYCILGTFGAAALIYAQYLHVDFMNMNTQSVIMAEILKSGIVNIYTNNTTQQVISVPSSDVVFIGDTIRVGQKRMKIPANSLINFNKIAEMIKKK